MVSQGTTCFRESSEAASSSERLASARLLSNDTRHRALPLTALGDRLTDHADRPLAHLGWIPSLKSTVRCCHALLTSKVRSLHRTQGSSNRFQAKW